MSQISYNIFSALQGRENHIRGLAIVLGTNQMTISRRVKELEEQNIVDHREEGKNKVFYIKKTLEAQTFAHMMELDKLLNTIRKYPVLRSIVKDIQSNKRIRLAVLFGSYAKEAAKKESDIDLYIETKDRRIKEEIQKINSKLSVKIGVFDKDNLLIKEIEKNHVIIKGVEQYYEKNKFFE